MQVLISLWRAILIGRRFSHQVITCPRSWLLRVDRCSSSVWWSLILSLVSWVRGMSAYSPLIAWEIAIIVVKVLVSCKWIWRATLMEDTASRSSRSLWEINVIACLACIYSCIIRRIHSMGSSSRGSITATQGFIMMRRAWIQLRRRRWVVHLVLPMWRILCTILIAVTNNLLGLIVESRVLLCAWVVETIRSEKYLVLSFIVGTSVRSTPCLPVASTSHYHGWFACRDTRA